MSARNVVIVESPAKAKTINKYLGQDYKVLASFGHVRDLPPKDGSVQPDNDFAMSWQVDGRGKKQLDEIASACKGAEKLLLATDPDREGEAISWHVREELSKRKVIKDMDVSRVVFHEITKGAIIKAMDEPRELNQELIDAYMARRALDYLVGFTLSPVLWRKLPGAKSAGRVQSVALRLICEREAEIEAFIPQEYWSVQGDFTAPSGDRFAARLTHVDGEKLNKFSLADQLSAETALEKVQRGNFSVSAIENKTVRRNPYPPFTTSTLQQEASRKLGMGASRTMQVAQKLYEGIDLGGETVGLISYMRTDSITLSNEAVEGARKVIGTQYGDNYLPAQPRVYKTKAKNAQEAHEAIRPTDLARLPKDLADYLDHDQMRLYELIWKRTLASQMENAVLDKVAVDLVNGDKSATMRANGSMVKFDGFLKVYTEDKDDPSDDDDDNRRLPNMVQGDMTDLQQAKSEQHFTQPPPRFTEASLVKKMEELGIGRPSTYASILKVLQDREYVTLSSRRFVPEDRGRLVTTFLSAFFERYFEYDFTAGMEEQLDEISNGRIDWKAVLREFWDSFSGQSEKALSLTGTEVRDTLDKELGRHFFKADEHGDTEAARKCPSCDGGRLSLNFGKWGAFIACSNYPDCRYTRQLDEPASDGSEGSAEETYPKILGNDPDTGIEISLRKGPYGMYVQLGEPAPKEKGKKAEKPKRASLLKGMKPEEITLEIAVKLLSMPRDLGTHPDSGELIQAGIGRYGPYLKHGSAFISLPAEDDILSIGINRAVEVIAQAGEKGKATPKREIGAHPEDGQMITAQGGRYGPYVKHGRNNASLPKGVTIEEVTLEQAVELLAARAAKKGTAKKGAAKKAGAKKASAKKTAAKKTAAKKAKSKKASAKKSAAKKAD
ncbi:type I DNA topoisomerase [Aestuariispira insulae]|uniref:DNA topoisomerase 1 n=1 Tax=Aestuariispira insulae TaxID=1461337 RepID=A0A3D9HN38_9PROT|nr:type I DNA topoisomerase [Aestuariispira insulae]RED50904.1 DNA topoisomerase I [Aestuariispira insulae]